MKAWNLISLTEARRLAVEALAAAPRQTEQVGLRQALGRIAACDLGADVILQLPRLIGRRLMVMPFARKTWQPHLQPRQYHCALLAK